MPTLVLNANDVPLVDGCCLSSVQVLDLSQCLRLPPRKLNSATYLIPRTLHAGIDIAACLLAGLGQDVLDHAHAL